VIIWALRQAPEGYEDEKGFHFSQGQPSMTHSPDVSALHPRNAG